MRMRALYTCASALVGILIAVSQSASARDHEPIPVVSHRHAPTDAEWLSFVERIRVQAAKERSAVNPDTASPLHLTAYEPGLAHPVSYQPTIAAPWQPETAFSRQGMSQAAWRVSEIASQNGDRDFLMVDKAHGRLFLFENGAPVFSGAALTGTSLSDRFPPDALSKTTAESGDVRYRVTPAGRFTVSPGRDVHYGETLDINEIRGKGWIIAIHLAPNAVRSARLQSSLDQDKHATEGCINVSAVTMRELVRLLPRRARIPLYILPMDERLITQIF